MRGARTTVNGTRAARNSTKHSRPVKYLRDLRGSHMFGSSTSSKTRTLSGRLAHKDLALHKHILGTTSFPWTGLGSVFLNLEGRMAHLIVHPPLPSARHEARRTDNERVKFKAAPSNISITPFQLPVRIFPAKQLQTLKRTAICWTTSCARKQCCIGKPAERNISEYMKLI